MRDAVYIRPQVHN